MGLDLRRRLTRLASSTDGDSLASRFRRRRFERVKAELDDLGRPLRVLDIGGTAEYWDIMGHAAWGDGVAITLLNLDTRPSTSSRYEFVAGDARSMPQFADGSFDVVFSNSVIEHVGVFDDQVAMAREVLRIGRHHIVQTPSMLFPVEPHFLFPFFALLPVPVRVWLVQHLPLGWAGRVRDRKRAEEIVASVRLMTKRELRRAFPESTIETERVLGIPKSFTVFGEGRPATLAPSFAPSVSSEERGSTLAGRQ